MRLLVEPMQRALVPEPGFLAGLKELAHGCGALLIFDEIVTGFRLAWGGAQERYGVEPAKVGVLVFVAVILQVSIFSTFQILGGAPDVVLLTLMGIALLRGSIYGASAGFAAGLLVDTANLATLGVTSLLLTIAGYWIGRYGETTGRDRAHAPFVSVAVATILVQFGALFLHYMLGDPVSARVALLDALAPKVALNLLLTLPVYALTRRALALGAEPTGATEVQLLG